MLAAGAARAETAPLWELGVGVGGLRIPHYRGAAESGSFVLPFPYLVYRGPILKADRAGARATLAAGAAWELAISAQASPPVDSADNAARRGMPELATVGEIGPSLKLRLFEGEARRHRVSLRLPVRVAVALERHPRKLGWLAAPNLLWESSEWFPRWNVGVQTGPVWADRAFNHWVYGVDAAYANAQRPAYRARGGYSGWTGMLTLSRRFDRWWFGAYLRSDWLAGAVFDDSPLLKRRHTVAGGVGLAWVFAQSERQVEVVRE